MDDGRCAHAIVTATATAIHTPATIGPVHKRNAAGTLTGIHGNTRTRRKNRGSARDALKRTRHAISTDEIVRIGSSQSAGRKPIRDAESSPLTASEPNEHHSAIPAHAAAASDVNGIPRMWAPEFAMLPYDA